jgi:hypothetical protein
MREHCTSSFYCLRGCQHIRLDIHGIVTDLSSRSSGLLGAQAMAIDWHFYEFFHTCMLCLHRHLAGCYTDATQIRLLTEFT